jgi:hypothetical protein
LDKLTITVDRPVLSPEEKKKLEDALDKVKATASK